MKAKIFNYANPFNIDCIDDWNEIRQYPHLCVSETLVQGLKYRYKRESFTFISTIDRFSRLFYDIWLGDPAYDIGRFVSVSNLIEEIKEEKVRKAMKFNQSSVIDALRFLKELKIERTHINEDELTSEQKIFFDLYEQLHNDKFWNVFDVLEEEHDYESYRYTYFDLLCSEIEHLLKEIKGESSSQRRNPINYKDEPHFSNLIETLNQLKEETDPLQEYKVSEHIPKKNNWYKHLKHLVNLLDNFENLKFNKVVIHGVHRFTPMILFLINHLNKLNIEVIFMFNYSSKFKRIYHTWDKVYEWTGVTPIRDEKLYDIVETPLGKAIGTFLEGDFNSISFDFQKQYQLLRFNNLSDFSSYVSKIYKDARSKIVYTNDFNPSAVLSRMKEQFYAVSGIDINEILRAYFPDQFGEKHFLSYPIGQFILGLYNMWDQEVGTLKIEEGPLKECLAAGFWKKPGFTPLYVYEKIKLFFSDLTYLDDYLERLQQLLSNVEEINYSFVNQKVYRRTKKGHDQISFRDLMRKFSFYNVSVEEIEYFYEILEDLLSIAERLFKTDRHGKVNLRDHYRILADILASKNKNNTHMSQKEIELVKQIEQRLSRNQVLDVNGTIQDVTETLHYYLSTKLEEQTANWIVRDFEQIDGGVLLSEPTKSYHYAQLSDEKMKKSVNDQLAWPLTENIFKTEDGRKELDIVLTCFREYKNFLRYSLFYGTYFLKGGTIYLSYIEEQDHEKLNPYFILRLLGIKENPHFDKRLRISQKQLTPNVQETQKINKSELKLIDKYQYSMCPYKFLLDELIEQESFYMNDFQCRYYYIFLLTFFSFESYLNQQKRRNPRRKNDNQLPDLTKLMAIVNAKNRELKKYFPFYNTSELYDIEKKAVEDLIKAFEYDFPMNDDYIIKKMNFLMGSFGEENIFSNDNESEILEYFKHDQILDRYQIDRNVCRYCTQREVCMLSFAEGD